MPAKRLPRGGCGCYSSTTAAWIEGALVFMGRRLWFAGMACSYRGECNTLLFQWERPCPRKATPRRLRLLFERYGCLD